MADNIFQTKLGKIEVGQDIYGLAYDLVEDAYYKIFGSREEAENKKNENIEQQDRFDVVIDNVVANIEKSAYNQGSKLTKSQVEEAKRRIASAVKSFHQAQKSSNKTYVMDPDLAEVSMHNIETAKKLEDMTKKMRMRGKFSTKKINIPKTKPVKNTKNKQRYIVYDLETTGTGKESKEVRPVSFGYKIFEDGKVIEQDSFLINPEMEIEEGAIETHHITQDKVKNAPTFKEVAPRIQKILSSGTVIGYNNKEFDDKIIANEMKRIGAKESPIKKSIDVLEKIYKTKVKKTSGHTLKDMAKYFGIDVDEKSLHDAAFDVDTTAKVAQAMIDRGYFSLELPKNAFKESGAITAPIENVSSKSVDAAYKKTVQNIKNIRSKKKVKVNSYIVDRARKLGKNIPNLVQDSLSVENQKKEIIKAYGDVGVGVSFEGDKVYFYSLEKYGNDIEAAKTNKEVGEIVLGMPDSEGKFLTRNGNSVKNIGQLTQAFVETGKPPVPALITSNEMQYMKLRNLRGEQNHKFVDAILKGDFEKVSSIGNFAIKNVLSGNPALAPASAIDENRNAIYGSKTNEQMLSTEGLVSIQDFIESIYNYNIDEIKNFYERKNITGAKFLQQYNLQEREAKSLIDAFSIISLGVEDLVDVAKGSFLDYILHGDDSIVIDEENMSAEKIAELKRKKDPFAGFREMIKDIRSKGLDFDLSSIKEQQYESGFLSISSAQNLLPFNIFGDLSNRNLHQVFNYLKRPKIKGSIGKSNVFSSIIGRKSGVDYGEPQFTQYLGGRSNDTEIFEALQRIISGEGQKKYSKRVIEQAKKILASASVNEGGILVTQQLANELYGLRETNISEENEKFDDEFLFEMFGLTREQLLDELSEGEGIGLENNSKILDRTTNFSKNRSLSSGDIVTGIEKKGNALVLKVEKASPVKTGMKLGISGGQRGTAHVIPKNLMAAIGQELGIGKNIQYITERNTKMSTKKSIGDIAGRMSFIVNEALSQDKNIEDILEILKKTTQIGKSFSLDSEGRLQSSAYYNAVTNRYEYIDEKGQIKNLFEGEGEILANNILKAFDESSSGNDIEKFGRTLLGDSRYEETQNLFMEAVNQMKEYPYFESIGAGDPDFIEKEGRASADEKERAALDRVYKEQLARIREMNAEELKSLADELFLKNPNLEEAFIKHNETLNDGEKITREEFVRKYLLQGVQKVHEAGEKALKTFGPEGKKAQKQREKVLQVIEANEQKKIDTKANTTTIRMNRNGDVVLSRFDSKTLQSKELTLSAQDYDLSTKIRNADGTISQENYQRTLLAQIRQFAQDGDQLVIQLGNATAILADLGIELYGENDDVMPLQTDSENIQAFNEYLAGVDEKQVLYNLNRRYNAMAFDTHGALYKKAVQSKVASSSAAQAIGINDAYISKLLESGDTDAANIVFRSKGAIATQLKASSGTSLSNLKEHVKKLGYLAQSLGKIKDVDSTNLDSMTKRNILKLQKSFINLIIEAMQEGATIGGQVHRYPTTSGRDIRHVQIGLDPNLDDNAIGISAGLAATINADYDGDKLWQRLMLDGNYNNYEEFQQAMAGQEQMMETDAKISAIMHEWATSKRMAEQAVEKELNELQAKDENDLTPEEISRKKELENKRTSGFITDLSDRRRNLAATLLAKSNFYHVGYFSNVNTRARNFLTSSGMDEEERVVSNVIRVFLETLEQDAISSKKVAERLAKGGEEARVGIEDLSKLNTLVRSGDIENALNFAENLGIDFTEGRQAAFMEATFKALGGVAYQEYVEAMGGENASPEIRKERMKALLVKGFKSMGERATKEGSSLPEILSSKKVKATKKSLSRAGNKKVKVQSVSSKNQEKEHIFRDTDLAIAESAVLEGQRFAVKLIDSIFDDTDGKHEQRAADTGRTMLTVTQARDRLLAKSNPVLAKQVNEIRNKIQSKIDSQDFSALSAKGLGIYDDKGNPDEKTWNFLKNFIGSGIRGTATHDVIETLTRYGFDSIGSMGEAALKDNAPAELKNAFERLTTQLNLASDQIKILGLDDSYMSIGKDIESYMDYMFPKDETGKRDMSKPILSEKHLALRFFDKIGEMSDMDIGIGPDQIWRIKQDVGSDSASVTDNKFVGRLKGFDETFQLSFEKLLMQVLAASGIIPNIDPNKISTKIIKIGEGIVQGVPFDTLDIDTLGYLGHRAYNREALTEEEKNRYNLMHTTGRTVVGGETGSEGTSFTGNDREIYRAMMIDVKKMQEAKKQIAIYDAAIAKSSGEAKKYLEGQKEEQENILQLAQEQYDQSKSQLSSEQVKEQVAENERQRNQRVDLSQAEIDVAANRASQQAQEKVSKDALKRLKNSNKAVLDQQLELERAQLKLSQYSGDSDKERKALEMNVDAQQRLLELKKQDQVLLDGNIIKWKDASGAVHEVTLSQEQAAEAQKTLNDLTDTYAGKSAKVQATIKESTGLFDKLFSGLKRSVMNLIDYSLAGILVGKVRESLSQVIEITKQLDAALVDLQIAAGTSRKETSAMLLEYNDLAKEVGRTTQEVAEASNDWLRAGYEGAEAAELTRASMELSTLGMIDASTATTDLISVLKGWKLETEDVGSVVDKLTVIICGVCQVIGIGHELKCR